MNLFASQKEKNSLYQLRQLELGPSLIFLMRSTLVHARSRSDILIALIIGNKQMFIFGVIKHVRYHKHSHWFIGVFR